MQQSKPELRRCLLQVSTTATFSDLYYEAAKSYAVAKGAQAADDQSASANVVVNGSVYFVVFIRERDGRDNYYGELVRFLDFLFCLLKQKSKGNQIAIAF